MTTKPKHPTLVEVEPSIHLALEDGETGHAVPVQPGRRIWVDPDDAAIAPLMDVYLHRVRDAD